MVKDLWGYNMYAQVQKIISSTPNFIAETLPIYALCPIYDARCIAMICPKSSRKPAISEIQEVNHEENSLQGRNQNTGRKVPPGPAGVREHGVANYFLLALVSSSCACKSVWPSG